MDVDLPKRTLVPGETINITARLTNMSNTNVEGVGCELKQVHFSIRVRKQFRLIFYFRELFVW